MEDKSAAVLGVGGVGGCIAAVLAHKGVRVTCVDREETVEVLQNRGLDLESRMYGCFTVRPKAASRLESGPDVLFVTVKTTDLDRALDRVDSGVLEKSVVIPLLNGLEHVEMIRRRLGNRVSAGSIRIESKLEAPGRVVHSSPFLRIRVASDGDVGRERLDDIAGFLTAHGIESAVADSEASVLWEKLARLAALACTTALTGRPIGYVRKDPYWRGILEGAVREAVVVAKACGAPMDVGDQMKMLDGMPESLTSSLQRDIEAGHPSELDAIAGAVVRAGRKHGIECPTFENLIRRIESEKVRFSGTPQQKQG